MSASSNSNSEGAEVDRLAGSARDVSPAAVNARLRQFVIEHRARPEGEPRAFRESDVMLASWAEEALAHTAEAERKLAEAQVAVAEIERQMLEQRGERLQ